MHFEFLIEDQSGKKFLEIIIPKIIDSQHTYAIHSYKGIGRIPQKLSNNCNSKNKQLLNVLPKLLKGFGKTFNGYPSEYKAAVIVICDLDKKCLKEFREQLLTVLNSCTYSPETRFCIAIEENESWYLGDISAIKKAFPKAKVSLLNNYIQDSICDAWELLADVINRSDLKQKDWNIVGKEKFEWAEKITPYMNIDQNKSPSFKYFCSKLQELSEENKNLTA